MSARGSLVHGDRDGAPAAETREHGWVSARLCHRTAAGRGGAGEGGEHLIGLVLGVWPIVARVDGKGEDPKAQVEPNIPIHGRRILDELLALLRHVDAREHAQPVVLKKLLLRRERQLK